MVAVAVQARGRDQRGQTLLCLDRIYVLLSGLNIRRALQDDEVTGDPQAASGAPAAHSIEEPSSRTYWTYGPVSCAQGTGLDGSGWDRGH